MSINLLSQYPGKVDPVVAAWPYGEPRNITAPGDGTGTPWEAAIVKDIVGLQQALLTSAAIVPSGTPDQVGASQYLQALAELIAGRAINYDESGVANTYILDLRAGQQAPASYFDGMKVRFTPGSVNTGPSNINVNGLGVKNIIKQDGITALSGGELQGVVELIYNGTSFIPDTAVITGSYTTSSLAASTGTDRTDITHGLGNSIVDFGYTAHGNAATPGDRIVLKHNAYDSNLRVIAASGTPTTQAVAAPAVGDIRIDIDNIAAAAQTITVDWWARLR